MTVTELDHAQRPELAELHSEEFTVAAATGRIAAVLDTTPDTPADAPVVLIPPTFTRTIADYGSVAWALAANGLRVVRYDGTDHVGASDGEMIDFSPWTAILDQQAMLDDIATRFAAPRVGIVAFSLAFRFSLRALAGRTDVSLLAGVGAVVNMRATLAAALSTDYFDKYEKGTLPESHLALGHRINRRFMEDCIELNLGTPASATQDVEKVPAPIVVVVNEQDPWVAVQDLRSALGGAVRTAPTELVTIPAVAQHELQRNPVAAETALKEVVRGCWRHLLPADAPERDVVLPSLPRMAHLRRVETLAAERRAPKP
jgi:Acyl transferase